MSITEDGLAESKDSRTKLVDLYKKLGLNSTQGADLYRQIEEVLLQYGEERLAFIHLNSDEGDNFLRTIVVPEVQGCFPGTFTTSDASKFKQQLWYAPLRAVVIRKKNNLVRREKTTERRSADHDQSLPQIILLVSKSGSVVDLTSTADILGHSQKLSTTAWWPVEQWLQKSLGKYDLERERVVYERDANELWPIHNDSSFRAALLDHSGIQGQKELRLRIESRVPCEDVAQLSSTRPNSSGSEDFASKDGEFDRSMSAQIQEQMLTRPTHRRSGRGRSTRNCSRPSSRKKPRRSDSPLAVK